MTYLEIVTLNKQLTWHFYTLVERSFTVHNTTLYYHLKTIHL
jgi:hypothetical protein